MDLHAVLAALRQGSPAAIPTETVYGLAANAENEEAIRRVYTLKNRPLTHPLIMHIAPEWDLSPWVTAVPGYARKLMNAFWPGPLTLILPCRTDKVSPLITAGQSSLALRAPAHPLTLQLLRSLGAPLVAPSANPFGKISPTTASHVQEAFNATDLLIFDGGRCRLGIESTIINATHPEGYQILRHGSIDADTLRATVPDCEYHAQTTLSAPGMLPQHYQPSKPLYCFSDLQAMTLFCKETTRQPFVLSFEKKARFPEYPGYQCPASPAELAFNLYYQLRKADASDAQCLVMELPADLPVWQGIRERLLKAGQWLSSLNLQDFTQRF